MRAAPLTRSALHNVVSPSSPSLNGGGVSTKYSRRPSCDQRGALKGPPFGLPVVIARQTLAGVANGMPLITTEEARDLAADSGPQRPNFPIGNRADGVFAVDKVA